MRHELIKSGLKKGWFKTKDHEFVGKKALSVTLIEYEIASFLPQFNEFETNISEGVTSFGFEEIKEDIKRYENLQRNKFINPFEL